MIPAVVRRLDVESRAAIVVLIAAAASAPFVDGPLGGPKAFLLGAVEGITEFLPVSSTGHLTVTGRLLDQRGEAFDAFTIAVQVGAVLAVLSLYWHRVLGLLAAAVDRRAPERRLLGALLAAFAPAALLGLAFESAIKDRLFGLGPVAVAWAVGGVLLIVFARRQFGGSATLSDLRIAPALVVGVAQAVALWPGVSRSLVTIVAACLVGLTIEAAVEFSFLLGVVTLGAATGYEILQSGDALVADLGIAAPAIGLITAAASALLAVRWMVRYLETRSLAGFGFYRLAAALVASGLLLVGAV